MPCDLSASHPVPLQGAKRKFAIGTGWRCAGRAAEASTLTFDQLEWEAEFGAAYAEVAQTKVSKMKLIAADAAADLTRNLTGGGRPRRQGAADSPFYVHASPESRGDKNSYA